MARAQALGLSVEEEPSEEKWMKYYSSHHRILLVGEGDFSFSLCLAQSFGSAVNIIASSLDTYDQLLRKYEKAVSNVLALTRLGAMVLHGVDATEMKSHDDLKMKKFDRIIFNFPHAGFHGKEDSFSLIQEHKNLVRGFFMNARSMLRPDGEIHVNHKTTPPYHYWCIRELGIQSFLCLIECVVFKKEDYPGYNNKRGDGSRSDEPFSLGKCSTFKFKLLMKEEPIPRDHHGPHQQRSGIQKQNVRNMDMILGRQISGPIHVSKICFDPVHVREVCSTSREFRYPQKVHVGMCSDLVHVSQIFSNLKLSAAWPKLTKFRYPQNRTY
ncbi:heavy metal-associated isoprenylated plant protein 41-like [Prosopis cineraria]|uniref:heavy metal-associated isoprenylated plant protein 41-like n=1 Tax=Prosopis cineraria TaxID=364024 RepID=UPI0024101382|nr:heavy metal-associated isoprenylated plant protein 41-like [Prosopis cineraria]